MSDLVVISFNDEHKADEVLLTLGRLQADHLVDLEDAAVVVRKQDGKLRIKQSQNLTAAGAVSAQTVQRPDQQDLEFTLPGITVNLAQHLLVGTSPGRLL